MELGEGGTLQWLGQKIGNHLLCRTVFHDEITVMNAICDEEVSHVEVPCAL